jgi:hypothetical protein
LGHGLLELIFCRQTRIFVCPKKQFKGLKWYWCNCSGLAKYFWGKTQWHGLARITVVEFARGTLAFSIPKSRVLAAHVLANHGSPAIWAYTCP